MPHEWAAASVAGIGVLGLGASAEPDHLDHPAAPAAHIVLAFLGLVALLGEVAGGGSAGGKGRISWQGADQLVVRGWNPARSLPLHQTIQSAS